MDNALTAAREARDHRRVNAVLGGAPLAALWGPNPVPRAGGRCLDVVRLLRITTDSPAVEATSTRCQAVLEAFRGRAATARRMIASARRTVTELGLRHALLEVEEFAGIIELIVDDPSAAEAPLRQAYLGFRRMGLDADTAEAAALLGRVCLTLGRNTEAEELCTESERLAGHALKASIAWRTLRALLLARSGDHDAARKMAESAVGLADRTDALVDHGDACLALATVLDAAGDVAGARSAAERAATLYERKGAETLAARAHAMLGERVTPPTEALPEPAVAEPENAAELEALHPRFGQGCAPQRREENQTARMYRRNLEHYAAHDWQAMATSLAPHLVEEDRRRAVNAGLQQGKDAVMAGYRALAEIGATIASDTLATRGQYLALNRSRATVGGQGDDAFHVDYLEVTEIDTAGQFVTHIIFDIEDIDAAVAELDARYLAGATSACAQAWSVITAGYAAFNRHDFPDLDWVTIDHRRARAFEPGELTAYMRATWDLAPNVGGYSQAVHRLSPLGAVVTHVVRGTSQDGFEAEWREVVLFAVEGEMISRCEVFDEADLDTALARFDELSRPTPALENAATRTCVRVAEAFDRREGDAIFALADDNGRYEDRRKGLRSVLDGPERRKVIDATLKTVPSTWRLEVEPIAIRGSRLSLTRDCYRDAGDPDRTVVVELLHLVEVDTTGLMRHTVTFDPDDIDAAIAELDARYLAGEGAEYAQTWSLVMGAYAAFNQRNVFATTPDWISIDHRRGAGFETGDMIPYIEAAWADSPDTTIYIAAVHRLSQIGAVVTHVAQGVSQDGFAAQWRDIIVMTVDGQRFSRSELFDGDDLDAALARFDELS